MDVDQPLPRPMAAEGPWSNREGWRIRVCNRFPAAPKTIPRPSWWPYSDLFCIGPADLPSWLERQNPSDQLSHLPVRGYCSHSCLAYKVEGKFRVLGLRVSGFGVELCGCI